jgi:glycerophosphoryl diester phosphodiesterase
VRQLSGLAELILTWPVNRVDRAAELVRFGVDGLITDDPELVRREHILRALA